jgi:hypothetical protein
MRDTETNQLSADRVNYEEAALATLEVDGVDYRIDTDHGSAVAVSQREPGTWDWTLVAEGRWDGSRLRAKGLDPQLITALAQALGAAMRERQEQGVP